MISTSTFFESFFKNARNNAVIVMDVDGMIIRINKAFESSFGYFNAEVAGKNFSIFFSDKDKAKGKPELELAKAVSEGAASDNNFFVHKNGSQTWVTGESVLVKDIDDNSYLLKIIHDINTEKILEKFLMEANDLIEIIFQTVDHTALILLDSRMKIVKVNTTFCDLFRMPKTEVEGVKLTSITHTFLNDPKLRQDIREAFINNSGFKDRKLEMVTEDGTIKLMNIDTKLIDLNGNGERRMLLVITDPE
jgi:PAS domain S-box-containing protein